MKRALLIMFLKDLLNIIENYGSAKEAAEKEQHLKAMKERVETMLALLIAIKKH